MEVSAGFLAPPTGPGVQRPSHWVQVVKMRGGAGRRGCLPPDSRRVFSVLGERQLRRAAGGPLFEAGGVLEVGLETWGGLGTAVRGGLRRDVGPPNRAESRVRAELRARLRAGEARDESPTRAWSAQVRAR